MVNSGEESVTNRNSLFAKNPISTLSKPGIAPEFVHDQLLLLTRLIEKTSKAAVINPDFEPTRAGLNSLKECVIAVNLVLKATNPELVDNSVVLDDNSPQGSFKP